MKYSTTMSLASKSSSNCIIIGIYESKKLSVASENINSVASGFLTKLITNNDISGSLGSCSIIQPPNEIKAKRILIVGLGKYKDFGIREYRQSLKVVMNKINKRKIDNVTNFLTLEDVNGTSAYYLARHSIEIIRVSQYQFNQMKSKPKNQIKSVKSITLAIKNRSDIRQTKLGCKHADAIVDGICLARDLGNLPPNICTPSYLGKTAQKLAKKYRNLEAKVLNENAIKKLGMHSFLSVTAGSIEPAKLIIMKYKGTTKQKPIVLVGKGVTFDTGGISLKPSHKMDEMKFDMCGAASVIGTIAAVAKLKLPININVIVPACENRPGGNATLPGDVVKSMSGQTIEILNTDAEGRLILCDALTYAKRFRPKNIIDVATLTGACVVALGHHRCAIMSNDDGLAKALFDAGEAIYDRGWRMPLGKEYDEQLKSNFADFGNIGDGAGGSVTAACFLGRFTSGMKWAHLDIAGTAWLEGQKKGSTGRPVPMLTEFILREAGLAK